MFAVEKESTVNPVFFISSPESFVLSGQQNKLRVKVFHSTLLHGFICACEGRVMFPAILFVIFVSLLCVICPPVSR